MDAILENLETYGYIVIFFYSLGGGYLGLLGAGVLSYAGKMDITTSIAIATLANFLGDTALFYLSRYQKSDMMQYLKKHRRKLALSHLLMKKHGDWIIFIQKFVYGIKTLIPIAIGLSKYPFLRFTYLNIVASIIWGVIVGVGSYLSGAFFMQLYEKVAKYPILLPIILITLLALTWWYLSAATKKR